MQIQFPPSFFWGASLSSYQTEGGNFRTDWALWEREKNLTPCKEAANHYSFFKQDFQLARGLGLNAIRTSLEWARINPEASSFSEEAFLHYREVLATLKSLNLKPFISLHHFTNPIWFIEKGGWLNPKNIDFFIRYVLKVVSTFKEEVGYWLVLNEPLVYAYNGFIRGIWPPGERSFSKARRVLKNMLKAYLLSYQEIKRIYGRGLRVDVSFAKHMRGFKRCAHFQFGLNSFNAFWRKKQFNLSFLEDAAEGRALDFIALNYYATDYVHFKGLYGRDCSPSLFKRKNALGWYVEPYSLYKLLRELKRFRLGIIIAENGSAEETDQLYLDYLLAHLKMVALSLKEGMDVRGYFWWSLLDNFEWERGFVPRFGLLEVNYRTFQRRVRPFSLTYAKICKEATIEIEDGNQGT